MDEVKTKRIDVTVFLAGFFAGVIVFYCGTEIFEKKLPEAFEIVKGDKCVGWAETNPQFTEFVTIRKAKSPGLFIAFPIWGDQKKFDL